MGRIHEANRDFGDCVKCLKMAVSKDPKSDRALEMRIKMAMVQFGAGDFVGFLETRMQLLIEKPHEPRFWGPCAVGAQFMGDLPTAITMMDKFIETLRAANHDMPPSELSELLFYRIDLMIQNGAHANALVFLLHEEPNLTEKRRVKETHAQLLLSLGRHSEVIPLALELLQLNSEDYRYHLLLQQGHQLEGAALHSLYVDDLQKRFPRSKACQRIPLNFLPGDDSRFAHLFTSYYRALLDKGAPSAFASVKSLYSDARKVEVMQRVIEADFESLQRTKGFPDAAAQPSPPTTLLWSLYYAAHHYDQLQRWDDALRLIAQALEHTPTLIDLYVFKARVAKHMGDYATAHVLTEFGRSLDTADRWLNTVTVRYALRAGLNDEAEQKLGLFGKAEEATMNVFDMQHQRYAVQLGSCYRKQGRLGPALKIFQQIEKVYDQLVDDHAQLNRYSMGAHTVGKWADMGRYMRECRSHPNFVHAIGDMIEIYLDLGLVAREREQLRVQEEANALRELEASWQQMSPKTRKQAERNHKKNESRKKEQQQAALEQQQQQHHDDKTKSLIYMRMDPDPVGEVLLHDPDPMGRAHYYASLLVQHAPKVLRAQILYGRVAVARGHLVQALGALRAAHTIDKRAPSKFALAAHVLHLGSQDAVVLPHAKAALVASLTQQQDIFLGASTVPAYLTAWATSAPGLAHGIARGEAQWQLTKSLDGFREALAKPPAKSELKDALRALDVLPPAEADGGLRSSWKVLCLSVFPHGGAFGGAPVPTAELNVLAAPAVDASSKQGESSVQ